VDPAAAAAAAAGGLRTPRSLASSRRRRSACGPTRTVCLCEGEPVRACTGKRVRAWR
jgi:hypothetical protein